MMVVGTGACTPVGASALASAASVRAGVSRLMEHPFLRDEQGEPVQVGAVTYIDEFCEGPERYLALALPALREALSPLAELHPRVGSLAAFVGLPVPRPGVPDDLVRQVEHAVTRELAAVSERHQLTILRQGHATGMVALQAAEQALNQGEAELCLVGGVDSYNQPATIKWLERQGRLHCSDNPHGLFPGEAAGFVLLTSRRAAETPGLRTQAEVLATAVTRAQHPLGSDGVCLGRGLTGALGQVLQHVPRNQQIRRVLCDLNGEPHRADEYGFAALRLDTHFVESADYLAPAEAWGDVGVASCPLFVCLAVHWAARGFLQDPNVLACCSSDAAERGALLLKTVRDNG